MNRATILVVDDEPLNVALLADLLAPEYRVLGARSGPVALSLAASERPDLVLLDVSMPGMDGHTTLARLREAPATAALPVIFVTALGGEFDEERGLALGAVDYIAKPIKPAVLLARVRTHLALKQAQDRLVAQNADLEIEVARRTAESLLAQDLMLGALAELAETRDDDTGHHVVRTQTYVELLARRLQASPEHADGLAEAQLLRIVKAAPMHDIGKIGIPDSILLKPARLTAEEFEVMKTHARIGADAIDKALRKGVDAAAAARGAGAATHEPPESVLFLGVAQLIAAHHHERWDGLGYPDGLAGTQIPLPARLMAVADVYDALTTRRAYKPPWPLAEAAAFIVAQSGRQFDPALVAAFVAIQPAFEAVAARWAD